MLYRNSKLYDQISIGGKLYNKVFRGGKQYGNPTPSDPNLMPGFTYRDILPQGQTAPLNAVDHVFTFGSEVASNAVYLPNLSLVPGSEIIYQPDMSNELWTYVNGNNAMNVGDWNKQIGVENSSEGYLYDTVSGDWFIFPMSGTDFFGFERLLDNTLQYIKYSGGVKSVIAVWGEYIGNLFLKFNNLQSSFIGYLQCKNAVIVDNAGNPI